ncbi:sigma-70 family RNA polymerase sigma factor [Aliiglaciecola sp. CAU 1673]|uniref:sigma-70 family RNA polymerase sigma factor n=1 Tax=Aliiglaciecola sp. CAU 1673 TaxID=3032595 RepID=UPI0023DC2809|nr:sigma-70 family RNA polymerase sigma factor [Aliiglaciecola sp. CAU 1673]MDF2178646.1 sigma-70 family RNA polymerase sigma factor [Aliiglaciecola sp. CAU 1673]
MTFTFALKSLFNLEISNEELMHRYRQSGDSELLARLYDNCADDLFHFLVCQSDAELAREIAQRTWLRVIERRHLFASDSQFKAWLFTLGRNLLMDEYRRQKRWQGDDSALPQIVGEDSATQHPLQSEMAMFETALAALPFEQREAFVLQQEGFGLLDIAHITGESQETIKSRLRYARQKLRQHIEKHHE